MPPTACRKLSVWLDPIEYIILITFLVDFTIKFFVGFDHHETGMPVRTQPAMAIHYIRRWEILCWFTTASS